MHGDLRLGLARCGRLAVRGYVPAFAQVPGMRLVAVADPVVERCERAAPGVPAFASAAELIASGLSSGMPRAASSTATRLAGSDRPSACGSRARQPTTRSFPLARQLEEFGRAVRGEPTLALGVAQDGVAMMATIEAARLSAANGSTAVAAIPSWGSVGERSRCSARRRSPSARPRSCSQARSAGACSACRSRALRQFCCCPPGSRPAAGRQRRAPPRRARGSRSRRARRRRRTARTRRREARLSSP